jgi:hypothetical protein
VKISFANSQSYKREAFSTLTMEMHSPFSAQRVGTENITVVGFLLMTLWGLLQLTQMRFEGSKEALID